MEDTFFSKDWRKVRRRGGDSEVGVWLTRGVWLTKRGCGLLHDWRVEDLVQWPLLLLQTAHLQDQSSQTS